MNTSILCFGKRYMSWCIYASWRAAGEENFGSFKWFHAVSSVFWSFPARPLPSFVIFF